MLSLFFVHLRINLLCKTRGRRKDRFLLFRTSQCTEHHVNHVSREGYPEPPIVNQQKRRKKKLEIEICLMEINICFGV